MASSWGKSRVWLVLVVLSAFVLVNFWYFSEKYKGMKKERKEKKGKGREWKGSVMIEKGFLSSPFFYPFDWVFR
jgi:hypothetical protein